jgi:hypothetical protein
MRVPYDLKSQDMINRDIHEHIKRTSTKMRAEWGFETESRLASQGDPFHLFTSCILKR